MATRINRIPNMAIKPPPMLAAMIVHTTPNSPTTMLIIPPIIDGPRPGFMLFILASLLYLFFHFKAPARGTTPCGAALLHTPKNYNPRPPQEGRRYNPDRYTAHPYFNPRPPQEGRLDPLEFARQLTPYFNPRPPQEGRQLRAQGRKDHQRISIHVPRKRDDFLCNPCFNLWLPFQSTSPARGTTGTQIKLML